MERRTAFLAIRWVAILALWLHVIYNRAEPPWYDLRVWTVTLLLVASNFALALFKSESLHRHRVYFYTFLLDLILVTVAAYLADPASIGFLAMLVLCLFAGALSGEVRVAFLFSIMASLMYIGQSRLDAVGFVALAEPSMLMRVPLLIIFSVSAGSLSSNSDQRRLQKAALLLEFDRRLLIHKPPDEIAATLVDVLKEQSTFKRVAFYIYNSKQRTLGRIGDSELPETLYVDQMPEAIHASWSSGQPAGPEQLSTATEWCRMQRLVPRTTFLVPAQYSARPQGMLAIEFRHTIVDAEPRIEMFRHLADRAASALINARLIETAQESAIGLHSLLKMSETVSSSLRSPEILAFLENSCTRLLTVRRTHLFLMENGENNVDALRALSAEPSEIEHLAAKKCFESGQPVILSSSESLAALNNLSTSGDIDNLVAIPLRAGENIVGVLEAVGKPEPFSQRDLALLGGLASQAAVALENARLYESMIDRADRIEKMADVLEKEKHKMEHVLASMEEGVILLNESGVALINHAGKRLLEPRGPIQLPADPASFHDPLGLVDYLRECVVEEEPRHETLAQGDRFLSLNAVRLKDGDAEGGGAAIAVIRDITELVRLGEKRSEFVSQVSHELRTPLSAIIGAVKLLAEGRAGELNETQARLLHITEKESNHLMLIINDLLDLAKLEGGSMQIEHADVDLEDLLNDTADSLKNLADDKDLELVVEADSLGGPVLCDPVRIRQVLLNLVGNAIKFTDAGGTVKVVAVRDGTQATVEVSDTGTGIPEDQQQAIFDKFEQVGSASARKNGTGLGLSIARSIVESHGGTLGVRSEVGVGSTFYFTLPGTVLVEPPVLAEAA